MREISAHGLGRIGQFTSASGRRLLAWALPGQTNHGGCAHYAFTPQWIEKAQDGEYACELAETLAYAFGREGFEDWVEWSPNLSPVKQGVLERRHVPLLCVNGKRDTTSPIEDHYLLFEYGDPKWGYFPDTGHMGRTPSTEGIISDWICERLGLPRR